MQDHKEWLKFAESDFKSAKVLLNSNEAVIGPALYHTQQCAEKALKAYLIFKKQPIDKTHDLTVLLNNCSKFDNEFDSLLNDIINLNPFSIKTRYPDSCFIIPDLSVAQDAIKKAEKIFLFVDNKIS